jgi:hypothetical protein
MNNLMNSRDFDPKKVYDDMVVRAKQAKQWFVCCYVEEQWVPKGEVPFDISIKDGIFTCRIICPTYTEAQTIVANALPVIKFIEDPSE